jgi:hypothetical protein
MSTPTIANQNYNLGDAAILIARYPWTITPSGCGSAASILTY